MTQKAMDYIETPAKAGSTKAITNKVSGEYLSKISTSNIIWHLVKRHKFAIVSVWAIAVTMTFIFPPVWDVLKSLVS